MLGGCCVFIFVFISPSVQRCPVKKSVNQLIKNKGLNDNDIVIYYGKQYLYNKQNLN